MLMAPVAEAQDALQPQQALQVRLLVVLLALHHSPSKELAVPVAEVVLWAVVRCLAVAALKLSALELHWSWWRQLRGAYQHAGMPALKLLQPGTAASAYALVGLRAGVSTFSPALNLAHQPAAVKLGQEHKH